MSEEMQRATAAKLAREILTGLNHDREDILIVADWLLTGSADLAMRFTEHTSQLYRDKPQVQFYKLGADETVPDS